MLTGHKELGLEDLTRLYKKEKRMNERKKNTGDD